MISEEDVMHAMYYPPQGTRAHARGMVIQSAIQKSLTQILSIGWEFLSLHGRRGHHMFEMQNPLDTYDSAVASIRDSLEREKVN